MKISPKTWSEVAPPCLDLDIFGCLPERICHTPTNPQNPTMSFYLPIYVGLDPTHKTDSVPKPKNKPDKPKKKICRGGKEGYNLSVFGRLGFRSILTTTSKDQDMASQVPSENGTNLNSSSVSTAVAIDKDKNSPYAVRWAIDNLVMNDPQITLVHVKRNTQSRYLSPCAVSSAGKNGSVTRSKGS